MRMKPRTILVITFSSLIIAAVLSLTIFGFYAYLEWKEKDIRRNYRNALYEQNGQLFKKYIHVDVRARIDTDGIFKGRPIVEGTIKNKSDKRIYSLKLKIALHDAEKQVVYVDRFYPIGPDLESLVTIAELTTITKNFLLEGDSISFKHRLRNCPPSVIHFLQSKLDFAKAGSAQPLELSYKIEGVGLR
jgi:hypothetical protein